MTCRSRPLPVVTRSCGGMHAGCRAACMSRHLHGLFQAGNCDLRLRDVPGHAGEHVVGVRQERLKRCALRGLLRQRQAQPLDLRIQQEPSQALLARHGHWHTGQTDERSQQRLHTVWLRRQHDPDLQRKLCGCCDICGRYAALPLPLGSRAALSWPNRRPQIAGCQSLTSIKCLGKGPTVSSYSLKQGSSVVLQ